MKDGALLSKGDERMTIKKENWKEWLKATGIRTVKTIAQTGIATIGTAVAMGQVDWLMVCSASTLAGILSLLTSVAELPKILE